MMTSVSCEWGLVKCWITMEGPEGPNNNCKQQGFPYGKWISNHSTNPQKSEASHIFRLQQARKTPNPTQPVCFHYKTHL